MTDDPKLHLSDEQSHDITTERHVDKLELTREGGFPAGTRIVVYVGQRP